MFKIIFPNRWLIWTIAIAVIVCIVLLWQINLYSIEQNTSVVEQIQFVKPKTASRTSALNIDTSTWKTYRNEKYGFEFKYPTDWEIDAASSDNDRFSMDTFHHAYIHGGFIPGGGATVDLWVRTDLSSTNLNNFILKLGDQVDTPKTVSVAGDQGLEAIYKNQIKGSFYENGIIILIPHNSLVYQFFLDNGEINYDYSKDFHKILSTFKFIEPKAVETPEQVLLEKSESWGPCPVEGACHQDTKLYYSGKLVLSGSKNNVKQLTGMEVQQIVANIKSSGLMNKTCVSSTVVDYWVTYKITIDGATRDIDGQGGCGGDLQSIEKIINLSTQ